MNEATTNGVALGVNVWWTCPSILVDGAKVRDALEKNGFNRNDIGLPTRRLEVSRAAYSLQNRRGKSSRRVTEKTQDNGKHIVFGILDRKRVDEERVRFGQGTTVKLDKDSGEVLVEGALSQDFLEAFESQKGHITDEDIRMFLRRIIRRSFGIAKRPTGGIYFVPEAHSVLIGRAQAVLNELGTGAYIYIEGVVNGQRERENVWGSVEDEIDSAIQDALKATERIEKSTNAVQSHKMKLAGLEELMDVYKGLLGEEAKYEELAERIEEAVKQVEGKMSELQSHQAKRVRKVGAKGNGKRGAKAVEAAIKVLTEAGTPLEYHELTTKAMEAGLYKGACSDPSTSFNSCLGKAINAGETRIIRVSRGSYALAS